MIESEITLERIPEFELPGHYHLYFVMMALKPKYRHTEAVHLLYHSFLTVLEELAANQVFFDDIIANAYTPHGVSVCRSLGMQRIGNHVSHGTIYYMPFYPLPNIPLIKEHPRLIELYHAENVHTALNTE